VDHFAVVRLLGQGGSGEVYLARDRRLGRKVALKLLHKPAADTMAIQAMLLEARAIARFNHPHIVTIHSVGTHGAHVYLALEYLEGETLKERMEKERAALGEVLRIAYAIATAVGEAHKHKVLHRDLKPANIVIPRDGRPRVVDFGLAVTASVALHDKQLLEAEHAGGTGTPAYMAPEQWRNETITSAADVWALGAIIYELASGRRPFVGATRRQLRERVCDPRQLPIELDEAPPQLAALCQRMLAKRAEDRPTCKEAVAVLHDLLEASRRSGGDGATDKSPFRGLLSFRQRHAHMFFGREAETDAFVERLRDCPTLPVVGPSGAGKSSFVQAGVIPRLKELTSWRVIRLRPGPRPFQALAAKLMSVDRSALDNTEDVSPDGSTESGKNSEERWAASEAALAKRLYDEPRLLSLMLLELATRERRSVLLFVDQLEEICTLVDDESLRRRFTLAVCAAADDRQSPVRTVLTLRDDFFVRLADARPPVRRAFANVTVLQRPDPDLLWETLVRPAAELGYRYDDPALVDEMVSSVGDEMACLPLLQFVATELWQRRDRERRLLLRSVYEQLGGVAGALARRADSVLEGLTPDGRAMARRLLLRLVTPAGTRAIVSQEELVEDLGGQAEHVLERLTKARLLSVRRGRHGRADAEIELVHDSLVKSWRSLARWIEESRTERALLARLAEAAQHWHAHGRQEEDLWRGRALRECVAALDSLECVLPDRTREFVRGCQQRQRRRHRRQRSALITVFVMLVVAAVGAAALALYVRGQRDVAEHGKAEALREGARAALSQGRTLEARAKLRESLEIEDSISARALWWQLSSFALQWRRDIGGRLFTVDISPKGTLVATAGLDGTVALIDTTTGSLRSLRGHDDQILSAVFSADGRQLATGSLDKTARVWDVASGRLLRVLEGHTSAVHGVSFSPDGLLLAAGGYDHSVRVWNLDTGQQRLVLRGHEGAVRGVSFSPDGTAIASGAADKTVRLWLVRDGSERAVLRGHAREIYGVAFSPDSQRLASGSYDHTVRVWDLQRLGSAKVLRGHTGGVAAVRFSPNGAVLASSSADGSVHLWDLPTGQLRRQFKESGAIFGVSFGPGGKLLATAGHSVSLRRISQIATRSPLVGHASPVNAVAFSRDGKQLASAGHDAKVRIWNPQTGEQHQVLSGHQGAVHGIAYSPRADLLASAGLDRTVRLWDARTGVERAVLSGHEANVYALAFSPDGQRLATASFDHTVRLWQVHGAAPIRVLRGHTDRVVGVAFSADGLRLASASFDETLRVWDAENGALLHELRGHSGRVYGVAFGRKDQLASSGYDATVRLWDLATGKGRVFAHHPDRVYALAFDTAGKRLGVPDASGTARLWDIESRAHLPLSGHQDEINDLAFSVDGALAATASDDGTVRVWRTRDGRPHWHAPALIVTPNAEFAAMLSHRGWLRLNSGSAMGTGGAWQKYLAKHARMVSQSPDRKLLCIRTHQDKFLAYDLDDDRPLTTPAISRVEQVLAAAGGCLLRTTGSTFWWSSTGTSTPLPLRGRVTAIGVGPDLLLAAVDDRVKVFDGAGELRSELQASIGLSALGAIGEHLLLGFRDGAVELQARDGRIVSGARQFQQTPPSRVTQIVAGPAGTAVVGFGDGTLGMWSVATGKRLRHAKLHGSIAHIVHDGGKLHAASSLGVSSTWDLDSFGLSHCALLREVWKTVPVVWAKGRPIRRAAPASHGCYD